MELPRELKMTDELKNSIHDELERRICEIDGNIKLKLVIVMIGHDPVSLKYVEHKKNYGESLGIIVEILRFIEEAEVQQDFLEEQIGILNSDDTVNGIMIQIPSPIPDDLCHLDFGKLCDNVLASKDVDGLSTENLESKDPYFVSATPRGILELVDYYNINLEYKKVGVLGACGKAIGTPLCRLLEYRKCDMTKCDPRLGTTEEDKEKMLKESDVLFLCTPRANLVRLAYIRQDKTQIVFDAGLSKITSPSQVPDFDKLSEDYKSKFLQDLEKNGSVLMGNLHPECYPYVLAYTPTIGSIGPMTVRSLFRNLVDSYCFVNK